MDTTNNHRALLKSNSNGKSRAAVVVAESLDQAALGRDGTNTVPAFSFQAPSARAGKTFPSALHGQTKNQSRQHGKIASLIKALAHSLD